MIEDLISCARRYREHAHAPYSGYKVGAAVMTEGGKLFGGCNIELATYTLTRHSEMVALDKAISEGERHFKALAVITDDPKAPFPCALCRQVMKEHCTGDLVVIAATTGGAVRQTTLGELYPESFGPENLE
jgi:cytidine deaminase